jgi:hypothetical protein
MITNNTAVNPNSRAIMMVFSRPRFVMPITIQSTISAPIAIDQKVVVPVTVAAASDPDQIMIEVNRPAAVHSALQIEMNLVCQTSA